MASMAATMKRQHQLERRDPADALVAWVSRVVPRRAAVPNGPVWFGPASPDRPNRRSRTPRLACLPCWSAGGHHPWRTGQRARLPPPPCGCGPINGHRNRVKAGHLLTWNGHWAPAPAARLGSRSQVKPSRRSRPGSTSPLPRGLGIPGETVCDLHGQLGSRYPEEPQALRRELDQHHAHREDGEGDEH